MFSLFWQCRIPKIISIFANSINLFVSRWYSNTSQPSLEMLVEIGFILNVDARRLISDGINKEMK